MARPRLAEHMNEGLERKLTLVSAPAGFGKTTLLSQWARNTDITVLWVSLDPADNDLNRFLTYCVAALQTLQARIGEVTLGALQAPQTPAIGSLLTPLINDVSKSSDVFALVLDDYHVIEEQPVHAALTFLLENLPNHAHVVIAGRADPPFSLAHMRALGQLYEIRAADLRFTVDEASALLDQAMDSSVSAEDAAALEARTEGWAAGLQLAAISMRGRQDISEFVQAFTGSHRFVIDYLVEEVLDQQPESLQEFLLATSILQRLTAPLCDAVTAESESQAILTRLEQANLFLVPLDDERRWYRYHHLFAELLRHRLGQKDPAHPPELHRRASVWYEENGMPEEAIHHAISGGHFRRAAQLTEVNCKELMARSEIGKVKRSIEALPEEWVRARPQLGSLYGKVLALTNQLDRVEAYLQAAEKAIHTTPSQPDLSEEWESDDPERAMAVFQGSVATCRAIVARARGDGLPDGQAPETRAGALPCRRAVGPLRRLFVSGVRLLDDGRGATGTPESREIQPGRSGKWTDVHRDQLPRSPGKTPDRAGRVASVPADSPAGVTVSRAAHPTDREAITRHNGGALGTWDVVL